MSTLDSVQVAVRVRPLNENEINRGSNICLETFKNESQIYMKQNKLAFTFNYVFGEIAEQEEIYDKAIKSLLKQLFKGYNVTILAYGQTGSGKTHTMGTSYIPGGSYPKGIIPMAVEDIFHKINSDEEWEYNITASFVELYQEQLYDLLSDRPRENSVLDIREDTRGVCIPNLTEKPISSTVETFNFLRQGSLCRATGATAMNAQSSRSHAIFTITLNINKKDNVGDAMTAKFHLVDLAGSERSKKTLTTGERFKEGVNINKSLLVLGNVISALCDGNGHIPYRDSKLTRLLQDSLGGNSQTLMIACISPSEYNFEETLSTLRYADRVRRIKNRPIINQDPKVAEIAKLKKEVAQLRAILENRPYDNSIINDMSKSGAGDFIPMKMCPPEHESLLSENLALNAKLKKFIVTTSDIIQQNYNLSERAVIAEKARDRLNQKLSELNVEYNHTLESFNHSKDHSVMMEPLHELRTKIQEIQDEQNKCKDEILSHEMNAWLDVEPQKKFDNEGSPCDLPGTPKEEVNFRENHIFMQAELSKELQILTKNLAYKEELVKQLAASKNNSDDDNTDAHHASEEQLKDMQELIIVLQRERDELSEQIKTMHQSSASNKIAEQRRKKLQELEQKISSLNKKVTEQARVIKMKEKSEEKINNLQREIMSMKQIKVRLIQKMKTESEKFRILRLERERELCKLKEQDRKRQNQMKRMEMLHNKQQNVLKRKVEEATAVNKRLKDAMALKSAAQERLGNTNKQEQVINCLDQEMEVIVSTCIAERTIDQLKNDQTSLYAELDRLKSTNTNGMSCEEKVKLNQEIENLKQDINLRSTQIADMQEKIMDSNQESKWRSHVDHLHNIMDAKGAIKHLFTVATDAKKDATLKEYVLKETKELCNDLKEKLKDYKKQIQEKENIQVEEQCQRKEQKKMRKKTSGNKELKVEIIEPSHDFDDSFSETDDKDDDPDWRSTPLYKRLRDLRKQCQNQKKISTKRGIDGKSKNDSLNRTFEVNNQTSNGIDYVDNSPNEDNEINFKRPRTSDENKLWAKRKTEYDE